MRSTTSDITPADLEYQAWLIALYKALKYKGDPNGFCFGVAGVGQQAILSSDLPTFKKRFLLLRHFTPDELPQLLDTLHAKRVALVQLKKVEFEQLPDSIKMDLEKNENVQKTLSRIRRSVMEWQRKYQKNSEEFEKEYTERKKQFVFNVWLSQEAKQFFTEDEMILLDTNAFFDSIEFHQNLDLYHIPITTKQDIEISSSFTQSDVMQEKGGLEELLTFYGVYYIDEWEELLTRLMELIKASNPKIEHPFTLFMGNSYHRITVGFIPEEGFCFVNADELNKLFCEHDNKNIVGAFSTNPYAYIKTTIFCNAEDKNHIQPLIEAWSHDMCFKSIHKINEMNIDRIDSKNFTWIQAAVLNNDISRLKKCLKAGGNPNELLNDFPLLVSAINQNNLQMLKVVIKAGADPLLRIKDIEGYTPLYIAIKDKQLDFLAIMLKSLIKYQTNLLPETNYTDLAKKLINFAHINVFMDIGVELEKDLLGILQQACLFSYRLQHSLHSSIIYKQPFKEDQAIPNYYDILKIPQTTSSEEIRKSYYRLSLQYHPDRNNNDPDKIQQFYLIKEAYDVLSDENKRRRYDMKLSERHAKNEDFQLLIKDKKRR